MNKWIIRLKNTYVKVYWNKLLVWATNKDDAMMFDTKEEACQYAQKELTMYGNQFSIEQC